MAFNLKTWPTTAASQPPDTNGYCPECGRPWRDPSSERPHPAAPLPWRAVSLAVVGLYLAVTFGLRAWEASRATEDPGRALAHVSGCPAPSDRLGEPDCLQSVAAVAGQAAPALARRQVDRALAVVAAGLLAVLVGLGSLARGRVRPGPRGWLPATLLGLWAVGEGLGLALLCLLLGGYAALLAGRLAAGGPLSWAVADQTAHRVFALIFDVAPGG
jgi:hypothetical protein